MTRLYLDPKEAKTEGGHRLRTLLQRHTAAAIARRLRVSERSVRRWAREDFAPDMRDRSRFREVYEWDMSVWDVPPSGDLYTELEEPTQRRS